MAFKEDPPISTDGERSSNGPLLRLIIYGDMGTDHLFAATLEPTCPIILRSRFVFDTIGYFFLTYALYL